MIAVDTSVVVAAFLPWHEGHAAADAALARGPRVPAHVLLEAYSVLTRMPHHRTPAAMVREFLLDQFKEPPLLLPSKEFPVLIQRATATGIVGGSIYDALIAATVEHAKGTLLTRDRRAAVTYQRMKVDFECVA